MSAPRLAETEEELWREVARLTYNGVHVADHGGLYPLVIAVGVGSYRVTSAGAARLYHGWHRGQAESFRPATAGELYELDRAMANDTAQVVLLSGWSRHRGQDLVEVLHQPRGMKWKEAQVDA
jgi:hypothetical protein